ncbi:hypothetical protein P3875_06685 [Myroides sp. JBRI-B21084]|uniref:hypothetical protein n=1 Tax=Myroides sp. JBRI-B21084 TaxID=3119977 RepID=UPI0026E2B4AA|nr:hypothetical protein [Paenimyroides cloacae]WKW45472.1 hypothetical protein P3875_06685 [Paenimyroides cloacae]
MKFIDEFIKTLFPDYSVKNSTENIQELKASLKASLFQTVEKELLESKFTFLQDRDSIHIAVTFGESDPIILNSSKIDFEGFIKGLEQEALHLDGEVISIVVTIRKTVKDSSWTIYDFQCFVSTLNGYDVSQFFQIFSKLFELGQFFRLKIFGLKKAFYTSSIRFEPLSEDTSVQENLKRIEIFDYFKAQCHFGNVEQFCLVPSDFKLILKDEDQSELNELMNRYANLISIIFLFDITSIIGNSIEFKINGYKSIKGTSDVAKLHLQEFDEYYNIFEWVYNGGNLTDKIGLSRNIISLHFRTAGELNLTGNPFQSVKSSFKVYEKQNIKQYIEIRNKISDQLLDFNNRANKIVETFASGFQKSTLALISFYISAIVIRVLSKGDFVNVFSLDATILSLAFLSGSLIYYCVSRWEIKVQRTRFVNSYENLKKRYTDLLESDDIKKILNNDTEFQQDLDFIDKKRKAYSRMWFTVVVLLASSTLFLFITYNLTQLSDTLIYKLIFGTTCNCE